MPIDKPAYSLYTSAGVLISTEVTLSQLKNYLEHKKEIAEEGFGKVISRSRILALPVHAMNRPGGQRGGPHGIHHT
ncbi:MAG: hypothetical protein NTW95_07110 [Candidatus Aminicenantes bacterium]|nr:hypothetical protein [Candidatus Aminicenantes bacterium]